jgi:hypothetical protein
MAMTKLIGPPRVWLDDGRMVAVGPTEAFAAVLPNAPIQNRRKSGV